MATCSATPSADISIFDRIASTIFLTYAKIIETITKKRDGLLTELKELRIEFEERIKTQLADLKELEQMREQIKQMCVKQNTVLKIQEASLAPIEKQILELKEESITEPDISFVYPLDEILEKLGQLGTIVSNKQEVVKKKEIEKFKPVNYSSKVKSNRRVGSWVGNSQTPNQIHVNRDGQFIFLPNTETHSVYVFSVESGKELKEFGKGILSQPYAVTTNERFCYVTDSNRHQIFRFKIEDFSLLDSTCSAGGSNEFLSRPVGLTSDDNELFVVDQGNHRLCVYDVNLIFLNEIGVSILKTPKDVKIFRDEIYVLDPKYFLHSFSRAGDFVRSVLTCGSVGKQLAFPTAFCIDEDGCIIVADHEDRALKIFSNEGELMHQVGGTAPGTEEVGYCFGVALYKDSIFMSSVSFKFIKVF